MTAPGDEALSPLTPTTTRTLLDSYGLAPRRADGQNFLVDNNVVERIVAAAGLAPGQQVLEIGPGLGALTRGLLRAGLDVTAVEIDAGFVRVLADTLGDHEALTVVHADAMDVDVDQLLGGSRDVPVVANLPYNVATPLLFHVLAAERVGDLLLMAQSEVGERWAAVPGERAYGAVSLKLALLAEVEILFRVPPTVFLPVPRVDSVMARVRRIADVPGGEQRRWLLAVVDECFRQPRKTLRNNLAVGHDVDVVDRALAAAGVPAAMRPGQLDVPGLRAIAAVLASA